MVWNMGTRDQITKYRKKKTGWASDTDTVTSLDNLVWNVLGSNKWLRKPKIRRHSMFVFLPPKALEVIAVTQNYFKAL